jgi:hypothetical protein
MLSSAYAGRNTTHSRLQSILATLQDNCGGPFSLENATGNQDWPAAGIYFFFDPTTDFSQPPSQWRLVRIGTVGVSAGSSNGLWSRLRQHRGNTERAEHPNGGNHRGSVWRRHVGRALIERDGLHEQFPHWGTPHRDGIPIETTELRRQEHPLELAVSAYIRRLPFLVVDIPGEPGPKSDRAFIEKNTIALVSQSRLRGDQQIPDSWLGNHAAAGEIRQSGLWNIDHVGGFHTTAALDLLEEYASNTDPISGSG